MKEILDFTEERFVDGFAMDLKTKAVCFADISPSMEYIEAEMKPMLNVVDFMFVHHFISEDSYIKCKQLHENVIIQAKSSLQKKWAKEAEENEKAATAKIEQQKKEQDDFIKNIKKGDKVKIKGTLIGVKNLPRYLEGGTLTVIEVTSKGNVKCRWDEQTVFSISPCYLKKL